MTSLIYNYFKLFPKTKHVLVRHCHHNTRADKALLEISRLIGKQQSTTLSPDNVDDNSTNNSPKNLSNNDYFYKMIKDAKLKDDLFLL